MPTIESCRTPTSRVAFLRVRSVLSALGVIAALVSLPGAAQAGKECSAFTVTVRNAQGTLIRPPIGPDTEVSLRNVPAGSTLRATGKFVVFDVDLDTLAVGQDVGGSQTLLGYVLTGAAVQDPDDGVTTTRTPIFDSKVPRLPAPLTGVVEIETQQRGNGGLVVLRSGGGTKMKIQAKDCSQGGLFQMEPEPRRTESNTLAQGFRYCYQASPTGRRFFTNFDVLGYDSPEGTTRVVRGFDAAKPNGIANGFARKADWSVMDGGRVGMVIGEDALEALVLEEPRARNFCRNDLLN